MAVVAKPECSFKERFFRTSPYIISKNYLRVKPENDTYIRRCDIIGTYIRNKVYIITETLQQTTVLFIASFLIDTLVTTEDIQFRESHPACRMPILFVSFVEFTNIIRHIHRNATRRNQRCNTITNSCKKTEKHIAATIVGFNRTKATTTVMVHDINLC